MANIYDVPGIEGLLKSSNTPMGNLYNVARGSGLHEQAMRDYLNPFSRNQTTQITEGPVADYMADFLKSYIDPNNQAGGKFGERRGPNQMQVTGLGESPNPFTASGIARAAEMAKDPSFQAENLFGEGTLTKVPGGYDYTGGKFDFNFAGPLEEMIFAPSSYDMKFNESMTPLKEFDRDFRNFSEARMGNNRFDELPSTRQTSSPRAAGAEDIKEEGIFSLGDILADLGRKGVEGFKDVAGRSIASQGLGTAGGMILGPMGALAGGIFGALKGGDMFTPSQSQIDFNALTPEGKAAVGDIYGPGGIMSGYNAVSAFGRGPVGAIDARLDKLGTRRAPQTDLSRQRAKDLFAAREKIMQTTLDSDSQYTGPKSSPRGQKAGVMDDDPFGGTSETTGTSSKIVCTMMNDSYGFGNFRNKIWLKHSKDLPKEYEIGYHKIFLPLVKFAKGQGKLNKVVKKTLEHVARHRTLDLKQEMKGKTHLLGRIYRKILEPICFIVGKVSNNV